VIKEYLNFTDTLMKNPLRIRCTVSAVDFPRTLQKERLSRTRYDGSKEIYFFLEYCESTSGNFEEFTGIVLHFT
jgi:hypothetical protein